MGLEAGGSKDKDVSAMVQAAKESLEKRRYERLKAGLKIKFRPVGPSEEATLVKGKDFAAPQLIQSDTREVQELGRMACEDISLGGVRISTTTPLAEGTRLWIQLTLPDVPIPVNAVAEVRWTHRSGSLCNSGLQFKAISQEDLGRVERFLALQRKDAPGAGS